MKLTDTTGITAGSRLPKRVVWATLILSLTPVVLMMCGVDLGTDRFSVPWGSLSQLDENVRLRAVYSGMRGVMFATLLEWTAFAVAWAAAFLSFFLFAVRRDITTPVLGLALFGAGSIDAFQVLVINHILPTAAETRQVLPFIWAVGRTFNALIIIAGAVVFIPKTVQGYRTDGRVVALIGLIFMLLAYLLIMPCMLMSNLPATIYPHAAIKRPWDVAPLLLYLVAAVVVLPRFYARAQTVFAHALLVSTIPLIGAQLHMALGSTAVFDGNFNAASALKIIAYLVPFVGLVFDYTRTHAEKEWALQQFQITRGRLEHSNRELRNLASVAAQSLKQPLSMVLLTLERLRNEHQNADRTTSVCLSRIQKGVSEIQEVADSLLFMDIELNEVMRELVDQFRDAIEATGGRLKIYDLPNINADPIQMRQLFANIIENAFTYRHPDRPPVVQVRGRLLQTADDDAQFAGRVVCQIIVEDNGVGFDPKDAESLFRMVGRLDDEGNYESVGMGLNMCRKICVAHDGTIVAIGSLNEGAKFIVTLPVSHQRRKPA